MMLNRRFPIATWFPTKNPYASGPRCVSRSHMRFSSARSTGFPSFVTNPAIPHIVEASAAAGAVFPLERRRLRILAGRAHVFGFCIHSLEQPLLVAVKQQRDTAAHILTRLAESI